MRLAPKFYVVKGNLSATLESIRAANKQSIIRYYDASHNTSTRLQNSSGVTSELNQSASDSCGWLKSRQHKGEPLARSQSTPLQRSNFKGRTHSLSISKADEICGRYKLRSPIFKKFAETGSIDLARSCSGGHNVQIKPQSDTIHESYGKSVIQYPHLLTRNRTLNDDRYTMLSDEIKSFCDEMTPRASHRSVREEIIALVQGIIADTLPGLRAEVFGSECVGLATLNSDIDFALWHSKAEREVGERGPSPTRPYINKVILRRLKKLSDALGSHPDFERSSLVYARFPLAKATHGKSGLNVQIIGKRDSIASQEYAKAFQSEFPELRPLYHIIRDYLRREGLTDVYKGGLGSYSIFMMIVAFLKLRSSGRGLGYQLIEFLEFYSSLDTARYALTITPSAIVEKKPVGYKYSKADRQRMKKDMVFRDLCRLIVNNENQPHLFCIQDPADPKNDLGRRNFAVKAIKDKFRRLSYILKTRLGSATAYPILPFHSDRLKITF